MLFELLKQVIEEGNRRFLFTLVVDPETYRKIRLEIETSAPLKYGKEYTTFIGTKIEVDHTATGLLLKMTF